MPALKLLNVTTSGKQCGPQVASEPSASCTLGAGPGGLDAVLLGGRVDEGCVDDDGCGAGVVGVTGALELRLADGDGEAVRDRLRDGDGLAVGEVVRVRCTRLDDRGAGAPAPVEPEPSGALDNAPKLVGAVSETALPPPPWFSSTMAPTAPTTHTSRTSSATLPTGTAAVGSSSEPAARNAPQPAQTNSSSATRPQRGHVVISRIQWHVLRPLSPSQPDAG